MLVNNTIGGLTVDTISAMFIAKINEPGVTDLNDDFFTVHDCIHWFADLGVSKPEERIAAEIQKYIEDPSVNISPEARFYIGRIIAKGVFSELKASFLEAKENMRIAFAKL